MVNIFDFLFPVSCLGCGESGYYLCKGCIGKQRLINPKCAYCDKPSIDGMTHIKCKKPFRLDGISVIWKYEFLIKKALKKSKYRFAKEILYNLADYATFYLKSEVTGLPKTALCVPIPIHLLRYKWRGYNQVEVLTKRICNNRNWEYTNDLVIRKKHTTPQSELSMQKRKKNIKGAFSLSEEKRGFVRGASVIVVDDIITSGSTLNEVGKVLKRGGAEVVWGLALAG